MRWSGSLQRGTWSSVTAGSTPPTPGTMASAAAGDGGERGSMEMGGAGGRRDQVVNWRRRKRRRGAEGEARRGQAVEPAVDARRWTRTGRAGRVVYA
nr:unnamed protein product [Digitaria exilis]